MNALSHASGRPGRWAPSATLALVLLLAACGVSTPASSSGTVGPSASPSGTPAGPIPLVIDTDVGADDVMAISYLTTRSSTRSAITVAGTASRRGPGERNVRNLLNGLTRRSS
jgi:hypothetical protein